jgi:hypothetical protein
VLTPEILKVIHAMRHLERWSKEYFEMEDRLIALIAGRKGLPSKGVHSDMPQHALGPQSPDSMYATPQAAYHVPDFGEYGES